MKDAYMIRQDGKIYIVRVHPYIIPQDLLLSLEQGEWLFDNTMHKSTKKLYIDFVAWFIKYQLNITSDYEKYIDNEFDKSFYGLSPEFFDKNKQALIKACETVENNEMILELLERELNQEFLRVRYGGKFETDYGVKDIYFRVSSTKFNWYNLIWEFVLKHKSEISTVTIEKDEVALGVNTLYKGKIGKYDHMPTDQFLSQTGNPVIEWKNKNISVVRHLEMGGTITGILSLPINNEQAWKTYLKLCEYENQYPEFNTSSNLVMTEILSGNSVRDTIKKYI